MDGAPACSRLGCDQPAVAVFAFDARECLVWLDPLDLDGPGGRGAGVLCSLHADRMSPPRDWNLLDRRGPESRLWIGRTATPVAVTSTPRRRERAPRSRPCAPPGPHLPFDAPATTPAAAPAASSAAAPAAATAPLTRELEPPSRAPEPAPPARTPWSPHDRPGPELEHVLDARTPLLSRAFEAARPVDDAE